MYPKDFVAGLKTTVIDENISIYKDIFFNTPIETATDEYWKRALSLFKSLPIEQQDAFFEIVRQAMVDTTSNILGIIDGVSTIDGAHDEFSLTYGEDHKTLTGDLQSLFLAEKKGDGFIS
ncbi:hypothetical protein KRR23_27240 [Pseudomonas sp. CVAP|uniref:hypothetical protein n=1 Tax=Pseudomonas sp. CVAP\|nr:hypothetical protein [Pseudomonas sp. CVAP\